MEFVEAEASIWLLVAPAMFAVSKLLVHVAKIAGVTVCMLMFFMFLSGIELRVIDILIYVTKTVPPPMLLFSFVY